jgi:hypothetical protein
MTQGYVFFGINDHDPVKNVECAYALSVSLKLADPQRETCVIVDDFDAVPKRYEDGFDYIIKLPYGRTETNHHNFRIDWWQIYYATPFDETIYLDTYTIAVSDVGSLWDIASKTDMIFGKAHDYRGDFQRDNQRFVPQDRNSILAFDAGMVYFRKDLESSEFFKMADPVFRGWRDIYRDTLTEYRVDDFNHTLMVNMVARLIGIDVLEDPLFDYTDLSIDFTWNPEKETESDAWFDNLNIWYTNNNELKINNHNQRGIVRYDNPKFITRDIIQKLNDSYRKAKTAKRT